MENELSQYDEIAIRHRAAFAAFSSIYEDKNPPPQPTPIEADSLFVPIALVVMILASVLVSGSRTISEFGGGLVGLMAFLMLEGVIVAYAFYRTRRNFTESRLETVRRMANFGLGLAFTVAVAANIHSVLKEKGVQVADSVNTIILVMVGISAPTLAFISGDIMAVESKANGVKARAAKLTDAEAMQAYADAKNAAWAREKARWGIKIDIESQKALSMSVHEQHGQAKSPLTAGVIDAIEWLRMNDPDNQLTVRVAASQAGVSTGTMGTAKKHYKLEQGG